MPVHISPQLRRQFLTTTSLFAGSLVVNQFESVKESDTWALLSDTHIDADRTVAALDGSIMAQNLEKVVAEIVADSDSLAGVIINGDCVNLYGRDEDYATLLELLQPIQNADLPIFFTLGNHDSRANLAKALGELEGASSIGEKRCVVIETPTARLLLLDSLLEPTNEVAGQLGADQLAWLEKELALPNAKPAVLFMHHNPQLPETAETGKEVSEITGLLDTQAFYDIMDRFPTAKANLWGHTHCWMVEPGKNDDYHRINLPALGCAFSANDPLGWVRATFTTGGMSMKLLCLDTQDPRHHESHHITWR